MSIVKASNFEHQKKKLFENSLFKVLIEISKCRIKTIDSFIS